MPKFVQQFVPGERGIALFSTSFALRGLRAHGRALALGAIAVVLLEASSDLALSRR